MLKRSQKCRMCVNSIGKYFNVRYADGGQSYNAGYYRGIETAMNIQRRLVYSGNNRAYCGLRCQRLLEKTGVLVMKTRAKRIVMTICFFLLSFSGLQVAAQDDVIRVFGGQAIDVPAMAAGIAPSVTVYLPPGYDTSNKPYSVLYVADANRYFLPAIAYQQALTFQDAAPEFIVIGIAWQRSERRPQLGPGATGLVSWLQNSLLPHVDDTYRTNGINMIFGWEASGGFLVNLLATAPDLFHSYLIASPTGIGANDLEAVAKGLKAGRVRNKHIYLTIGSVENWATPKTDALAALFTKDQSLANSFKYNRAADLHHYSTPLDTLTNGLLDYHRDYVPLRFYSREELEAFGGLDALGPWYQARGKRYRVNSKIHPDTIHYLFNLAWRSDDPEAFENYMDYFPDFVERRYHRERRFLAFGDFLSRQGRVESAKTIYEIGLAKLPGSKALKEAITALTVVANKER